jgi:hypothetical protein
MGKWWPKSCTTARPRRASYTQAQARAVFERAGLVDIELYSNFTFDPVKPEDTVYVAVGRKNKDFAGL